MGMHRPTKAAITLQEEIHQPNVSHHKWLALTPLVPTDGLGNIEERKGLIDFRMDRAQRTEKRSLCLILFVLPRTRPSNLRRLENGGNVLRDIRVGEAIHRGIVPGAINGPKTGQEIPPCFRYVLRRDQWECAQRSPLQTDISGIDFSVVPCLRFCKEQQDIARKLRRDLTRVYKADLSDEGHGSS